MAENPQQKPADGSSQGLPAPAAVPVPGAKTPPPVTDDELKQAMSAFRKRLKLTILDQESKLGGGRPVTSGKKSGITGIVPPNQFRREIWKELAARKQLKDMGGGFYTLP
jgi:hypothetical protein